MTTYVSLQLQNEEVFTILKPMMTALGISTYKPEASGTCRLLHTIYLFVLLSWYLIQIPLSLTLAPVWSFSPQFATIVFQKICEIVVPILVILQSFYDNNAYLRSCGEDVNFADQLLYAKAIKMDFKKLRMAVGKTFIFTTVYFVVLISFGCWFLLWFSQSLSVLTMIGLGVVEASHVLYSVYFNYFFCVILLIFKYRFQKLNEQVKLLRKPKWVHARNVINVKPFKDGCASSNEVLEKIKTIKFVHALYRQLMVGHNYRFGMPLLLQFTQNGTILTLSIYSLLLMILNVDKFADFTFTSVAVIAAFRSLTMIGSTVFFCTLCSSEANNMKHVVHDLMSEIEDNVILRELEDFSLELIHGTVVFNACNFYAIDYSLITKIFGSVASYVIILLQFGNNDYKEILIPSGNETVAKGKDYLSSLH